MTIQQIDAADDNVLCQPINSPIAYTSGQPIYLIVYNRFNHTNLNEIRASYIYKGERNEIALPSIQPHQKGRLTLNAKAWTEGERVRVEFRDVKGMLIDAEELILGSENIDYPQKLAAKKLSTHEQDGRFIVSGEGFEIPFNRQTGFIENATVGKEVVIEKGPFLNLYVNLNHLTGAEVRKKANFYATNENDWKMASMDVEQSSEFVAVKIKGTYKETRMDYEVRILPTGELSISYVVEGAPNGYLRETGLAFHIPSSIENLSWKRKGYWSCYPKDAFAGNQGKVNFYASKDVVYGKEPAHLWHYDNKEYYYWSDRGANCDRPLTRVAKGMKENIYYYTLSDSKNLHGVSVISTDAMVACRLNTRSDSKVVLYTNNRWDYPEIAWGNYCKTLEAMPCYGEIKLQIK